MNLTLKEPSYYHGYLRGPAGTGAALHGDPPVELSADKNIRWKAELPGTGFATPIVWGDRVFVSVATITGQPASIREQGQRGRGSGQLRGSGSRGGRGSGNRRGGQQRDIAPSLTKYEVMALDRKTGKVVWQQTAKEEVPHQGRRNTGSWASPSAVTDGEHLIAYFGSRGLYCYDMDGNLQWEKDFGDLDIQGAFGEGSSPALHGNTIVINWDHQGESFITALDKRTGKELWKTPRDERTTWTTPLIVEVNGKAQAIVAAAITRAYDLETGSEIWHCEGLVGGPIPTPVHQNGLVYVTSTARGQGVLMAIHLAKAKGNNTLDDSFNASPVIVGKELYLRGQRHLYCIASD